MKGWENVTLGALIEAEELSKLEPTKDPVVKVERQVRLLSLLSGYSEDYIWNLTAEEVKRLQGRYDFIHLEQLGRLRAPDEFSCGGYDWIPLKDITKLTPGQFIDVEFFRNEEGKQVSNLPAILATICTPVKRYPLWIKVTPKLSFTDKVEILKGAKVVDVYPLALFFCRVLINYSQNMLPSLKAEVRKLMTDLATEGSGSE